MVSYPCREGLEDTGGCKLAMSWQCALAAQTANCIVGCIKRDVTSRLREVILPTTPSTLERAHLECCILLWNPQHKKDTDLLVPEGWSTSPK